MTPRRLTASEMHMRLLALRQQVENNRPIKSAQAALLVSYVDDLLGDLKARTEAAAARAEKEAANA